MPSTLHLPVTVEPGPLTTGKGPDALIQLERLAPAERPRERLRALGVRSLGAAELLAVILGSGSRGRSSLRIAHEILAEVGGVLRVLANRPVAAIGGIPGVGPARAMAIVAAFELGRRTAAEPHGERVAVHSPQDVVAAFAPHLEALPVEEFHVAILDAQHHLERDVLVTRGILDSSLVHPREVFREAIAERAASIILVHNHPSGDPTPSAEDRIVTSQLVAAGTLLGIPVRDHVVIGRGRYVSFAEAGWLSTVR
ncbi:MAG: DNA repair protein RadC [Gemmatimonadaceae bacterium]|nr:DNA repair protein RadC [Gemmatimonadaceae bacterium]